jgi:hypothetical protein
MQTNKINHLVCTKLHWEPIMTNSCLAGNWVMKYRSDYTKCWKFNQRLSGSLYGLYGMFFCVKNWC